MKESGQNFINRILKQQNEPDYVDESLKDTIEIEKLEREINLQEKEIKQIEKRFEILVEESSYIYEIVDQQGKIKYISGAVEKVTGYKAADRINKNAFEFYDKKELKKLKKMFDLVLEGRDKKIKGHVILRTKSGEFKHMEVIMQNLLHEPAIGGIAINYRDVSRWVEREEQIAYINTHDGLTGLPNDLYCRRKLRLKYKDSRENKRQFALMMVAIDGLKDIKHSLGHEISNGLIIKIANRIKKFLGEDFFLSRYSEEYFAIIIEDLKKIEEYESMAEEIIKLVNRSFKIDKYEFNIHSNLGICMASEDMDYAEVLIQYCKIALLRAQKEGKNGYRFYSSDLDIQNYKEFTLRNDLYNAIDREQLFINYQPIVSLKDNEILGVETLLRWEHPDWGVISPREFIYLAEETNLIIDIGKWVLRQICKSYRAWLKQGLAPIKVSINFSEAQFFEEDFAPNIKSIIDEFGLDPKFLIMEIREDVLTKYTDKAVRDLQLLQSYGIQIAIDNFMTGLSSLAYLNSFNIDRLKIDRNFIRNISSDRVNILIVKTIIDLAKELGIKLVAEGIENWDQLSILKNANCYAGQGFLFSKPLELEEFEKVLAQGRCQPHIAADRPVAVRQERRKLFRVKFLQLLEGDLTILELGGKKIHVGSTKILIKNMGPGGLCFISDIKLPVKKDIILQFTTNLVEKEIRVYGHLVWTREADYNLHEYGVEFTIDENERIDLIKTLNEVQIKMRKNALFAEGSFISGTHAQYFS